MGKSLWRPGVRGAHDKGATDRAERGIQPEGGDEVGKDVLMQAGRSRTQFGIKHLAR
jgi:hypothetical protein